MLVICATLSYHYGTINVCVLILPLESVSKGHHWFGIIRPKVLRWLFMILVQRGLLRCLGASKLFRVQTPSQKLLTLIKSYIALAYDRIVFRRVFQFGPAQMSFLLS